MRKWRQEKYAHRNVIIITLTLCARLNLCHTIDTTGSFRKRKLFPIRNKFGCNEKTIYGQMQFDPIIKPPDCLIGFHVRYWKFIYDFLHAAIWNLITTTIMNKSSLFNTGKESESFGRVFLINCCSVKVINTIKQQEFKNSHPGRLRPRKINCSLGITIIRMMMCENKRISPSANFLSASYSN